METAQDVVNDILQEILVQANEQSIEAVDFQFVVRYMNRYMSELAVTAPLGYTEVTNPTDLITIPAGAINGLVYNVALQVLNSYDIDVGPTLYQNAKRSRKIMLKIARNTVRTKHPSTLPIGSGNECNDSVFYTGETDATVTEQNGNIILEDVTNQ